VAYNSTPKRMEVFVSSRIVAVASGAVFIALGLVAGGWASGTSVSPPSWVLHEPYSPTINPADFVAAIDNPYFPLKPGTGFHYEGYRDASAQTDDLVVTSKTKKILGVTCTVVRDTVSEHGKPLERTFDWYAQDKHRNVWYMGEDSLELKNGRFVRASDSWRAGVNGAKPGIIVEGHPRAGDVYRQEYYRPGGALDQARVLRERPTMVVPSGTYEHSLATVEWSPVEPQLEKKWYAAGIGEIREQVVQGGHEGFELVSVTR
jgi:hypothetical protein